MNKFILIVRDLISRTIKHIWFIIYIITSGFSMSQELPVLSPIHTSSFLYNPSLAGGMFNTTGSFFVSHKSSFSGVPGNPVSNVFSGHAPVSKFNIGLGGNLFIDKANVVQTIYSSVAFSYHLVLDHYQSISFGVSTDLYHLGVDMQSINVVNNDRVDPNILKYNDGELKLDFSFGLNYQTEFLALGGTANRLRQFPAFTKGSDFSNCYYSAYVKGIIPTAMQRDRFEPMITYRQLPYTSPIANLGFIYSYKSRNTVDKIEDGYITGGTFIGSGGQISAMLGIKLIKRIHLLYCYESSGKYQKYIGPSHELTLTYDIIVLNKIDRNSEYLIWGTRKTKLKRKLSIGEKKKRSE